MAVNGTSIKQDIDDNLSNKGYRGVRVFNVVTALKNLVDWVVGVINGNQSTWLRISDNQPGGATSDGVYRTGKVNTRGGLESWTQTPNANPLAQTVNGSYSGLQIIGANGGPAYMEFHQPGNRIDQLGVDSDGVLKYRTWGGNTAYPAVLSGRTTNFGLVPTAANRKISLNDAAGNDHQFFGFGLAPDSLRYQVGYDGASHIFYSGLTPVTSKELMRITGDGSVGIQTMPAPNTALDVANGWANFHGNVGAKNPGNGVGINMGWNYSSGGAENTLAFGVQNFPGSCLNICSWDGVTMAERMRIDASGNTGIGTSGASSRLQVTGVAGHNQFRLEKSYTPTATGDANGQAGQVAWDTNYFYVKTSAGWKRAALGTF